MKIIASASAATLFCGCVFSQSTSDILVSHPSKPYSFTKENDICEDFDYRMSAILTSKLTGSETSPDDLGPITESKSVTLLKTQNDILESQLLIMQQTESMCLEAK